MCHIQRGVLEAVGLGVWCVVEYDAVVMLLFLKVHVPEVLETLKAT